MKRVLIITFLIAAFTFSYSFAQMGQGQMMNQGMMGGQSQQQTDAPPYSGYGMGPGMMGGYGMGPCMMGGGMMGGYGMGPGMMGGYGMGPGMMGGYGMGPGMMGHMGGMMGGYGMGGGMMGPGGQRGYNQEAYQKYLDDTADLRKKLNEKKFDYFEAIRNPKPDREGISKLEKEIRDLQWDIYEKAPK